VLLTKVVHVPTTDAVVYDLPLTFGPQTTDTEV
jgi:hypothetical protein